MLGEAPPSRNMLPLILGGAGLLLLIVITIVAWPSDEPDEAEEEVEVSLAERLRPVVEISLFRIAQEALSNMARHSDASEGRVELSHDAESITLMLEDDGRGFDPTGVERARRGPGLGLAGMEERVHLLGGTWQCKSEPGNGTRITVTVPVLYREGEVEGQ